MLRRGAVAAGWICCLAMTFPAAGAETDAQPVDAKGLEFFERNIRPLLVERCYKCHSANSAPLRGGLMLDSHAAWQRGGDSGRAIVPGDPDASLLIKAVRYQSDEVQMPPEGKLPEREIASLVEWIKLGAPDPREGDAAPVARKSISLEEGRTRWAFQPLVLKAPPTVADEAWPRTPLDRFILAKLEAQGISPGPAADRRRLIRRAYFDLIGLPPTPEEVEAFVNDPSPNAFEKVVDHLLDSPHYGERWARHWLDLVRYAESHGFEQDYDRPSAYHYRDFVIKALNQDLPYDTFVRWQLAGDEIEPDNPLALMATGFLAAGTHATQITKNQVEKERYDELDDMSATIGTSMLGLTIGCARCHDHKFDPISTQDYYRLLSTFTTTVRSEIELNLDEQNFRKAKAVYEAAHAPLVEALAKFEQDQLPARFDAWLAARPSEPAPAGKWLVLELDGYQSKGGATLTRLDDGSLLASGKNPDHDEYTFVATTNLSIKDITAVRIEALAHESFVKSGPSRASNGNFALTQFKLTAKPLKGDEKPVDVKLANAKATFEQQGLGVAGAIDDNAGSAWAVDPEFGKNHAALFECEPPAGFEGGAELTFTLKFDNNTGHSIGRPRLSITTAAKPVELDGENGSQPQAEIAAVLARTGGQLSADDKAAMLKWYRPLDDEWRKLSQAVKDHAAQTPQPQMTKVLISSEGLPAVRLHTQGGDFLEATHFLERGDPNRKKEAATQSFLQILMNSPEQESHWHAEPPAGWRTSYRRTSLAKWLTDVDAGAGSLLARVIVNRLWQHHLGRGIVATASDFGAQGERPTHPELLDWLAGELIRNGWRLKPIHRLIMTSAAYAQSSADDPAKAAIDPANKLFWRYQPRRLEAEAIRDSILAVGGLLDERMFGPGTLDESQKRRSIYFFIKRSKLIAMMMLFDAPDALSGIGVRPSTTVAPQALLLLNNPLVRESARAFAARLGAQSSADDGAAIRRGYLTALGRTPSDAELADGAEFLKQQAAAYAADGKPDGRTLALADFCQVLLGLNEFVYVD